MLAPPQIVVLPLIEAFGKLLTVTYTEALAEHCPLVAVTEYNPSFVTVMLRVVAPVLHL